MVLPDFVKSNSKKFLVLLIVVVLAELVVVFVNNPVEGSIEDTGQDDCASWEPAVNPVSEEMFGSVDNASSFYDEHGAKDFEVREADNGAIQVKKPCGTVGGEISS